MLNFFPFLFVFFWSSAFVSGQIIVQSASPFASLSFRFIIVALGFLLFAYFFKEKIIVKKSLVFQSAITGIFFHGFYLGGVFFSYSVGLSATLSALIVGLSYYANFVEIIGSIGGFTWNRFYWLNPLLWYVLWAVALIEMYQTNKLNVKFLFSILLISIIFLASISSLIIKIFLDTDDLFPELFNKVRIYSSRARSKIFLL